MKKRNLTSKLDLNEWAQRLEAGRTDDPELVLAQRLSAQREEPVRPADDFRLGLRSRLIEDYAQPDRKADGQANGWLYLKRVIAVIAAACLLIIVLLVWPRGVQGVSAAEILQKARIGEILPAEGNVIYDRLRLDWAMRGNVAENVTGEIWYVPGSQVYRYQLTSASGEVLFYQAYDGEYTTQSVHNRSVGVQPVEKVYRFKGFVPLWVDRPGQGGLLANPSPVSFWVLAVHQSLVQESDCGDLFCLLGLSQDGWKCEGKRCNYDFGEMGDLGSMGLELVLKGKMQMEDGREVFEIRLLPGGALLQYLSGFGTVYVDANTYQIVKVAYSMKSSLLPVKAEMSLEHLEREILKPGDLPVEFFKTPPQGVDMVPWEGSLQKYLNSQFGDHENRAWVISVDPPSGTRISGEVTFNIELGYQLTGLPYANLKTTLWGVGKDTASGGSSVPVQAGEGVVKMSFSVDTDRLEEGAWALGTDLGIYIDAGPSIASNDLPLFDTQWCVRCDPAQLPTQPAVLGTYWHPLVQAMITGKAAEGYQVKSIHISPTHVLLHRSGQVSEDDLPQVVETEPIDVQGFSETRVITVNLQLPETGEMIGKPQVTVTIEVGPSSP